MKPAITLTRAMCDPQLLGGPFQAPSFWTWFAVAKLIDGLPLEGREVELFKQCTGRTKLPTVPARRFVLLVGRIGGKDRFLSAVAVWRAALCADWDQHMSAGEQAVVLLLGADKKQAHILRRYAKGLLQAPLLAAEVTRFTDNVIEFRNGAVLEIATNDVSLVRGRSAIAVLGSEACYWRTDEMSHSSDEEVVAAALPSMAMCPDGGLLLLGSSVYRKRGFMYRKWKTLHGTDNAADICWLASSATMNPKLPAIVVEQALADDREKASAEFLSQWRSDVSDFVPQDVIEACVDVGVRERAPLAKHRYVAFADAAGGTGQDAFAVAIAHKEADNTLVLDALRVRAPRFVPAQVVCEYAQLLKSYHITSLTGDKWAGGFHEHEWRANGISYTACEQTTSENYLAALPLLLSGRARLIDDALLHQQLAGLERRAFPSGREAVSHAQSQSAHDDAAAAAAGALVAAAVGSRYPITTRRFRSSMARRSVARFRPRSRPSAIACGVPRRTGLGFWRVSAAIHAAEQPRGGRHDCPCLRPRRRPRRAVARWR